AGSYLPKTPRETRDVKPTRCGLSNNKKYVKGAGLGTAFFVHHKTIFKESPAPLSHSRIGKSSLEELQLAAPLRVLYNSIKISISLKKNSPLQFVRWNVPASTACKHAFV
ncbi:MAG: hypothetical protein JW793_10115, partial [Acidobacteria bacterium]|nr:hypothetical protein [Acidobacteriota bacterium]